MCSSALDVPSGTDSIQSQQSSGRALWGSGCPQIPHHLIPLVAVGLGCSNQPGGRWTPWEPFLIFPARRGPRRERDGGTQTSLASSSAGFLCSVDGL